MQGSILVIIIEFEICAISSDNNTYLESDRVRNLLLHPIAFKFLHWLMFNMIWLYEKRQFFIQNFGELEFAFLKYKLVN